MLYNSYFIYYFILCYVIWYDMILNIIYRIILHSHRTTVFQHLRRLWEPWHSPLEMNPCFKTTQGCLFFLLNCFSWWMSGQHRNLDPKKKRSPQLNSGYFFKNKLPTQKIDNLPSRELTYPTLGKNKTIFRKKDMLVPRRVTPSKTKQHKHTKKSFCHFGEDVFLPLFHLLSELL